MNKMLLSIIIAIVAAGIGYVSVKFLGSNNPVEQECEKIIKDETGASIELSTPPVDPTTPKST